MDNVICLAPAHFEQVLGSLSGNRTQAADEDDMLRLELWEQDRKEVTERVVEEDVEDETYNGQSP